MKRRVRMLAFLFAIDPALQANVFHLLGGSRLAGGVRNEGQLQVFRW